MISKNIKQRFPLINSRYGASGSSTPVLCGTAIRVQTIITMHTAWGDSVADIAESLDLNEMQVQAAINFHEAHREEIDANVALEAAIEQCYCLGL